MDTQVILATGVMLIAMPFGMAQDAPTLEAKKKETFITQSSRNLVGEGRMAWIAEMRTKLPMARRQIGPFGMTQNPHIKVAQKTKVKPKPGAFLNAIKAMKVNAVLPADKKFIIGSREFRAGDSFPIIRGQRQFNIQIVSVKSDHIIFKNVDTGEYVKRNLNTLPPGMSRNNSIDSVKGVIPASKKDTSPLHLDSSTLPTSTKQDN